LRFAESFLSGSRQTRNLPTVTLGEEKLSAKFPLPRASPSAYGNSWHIGFFAESLTGALGKEPDGANTVSFAESPVSLSANLGLCRELWFSSWQRGFFAKS